MGCSVMIVIVASHKGGVGKTTTAVHIAACLSRCVVHRVRDNGEIEAPQKDLEEVAKKFNSQMQKVYPPNRICLEGHQPRWSASTRRHYSGERVATALCGSGICQARAGECRFVRGA